jgi:hypothetical protein
VDGYAERPAKVGRSMMCRFFAAWSVAIALLSLSISSVWADPPSPGDPLTPDPNKPQATTSVQSGPNGVTIRIAVSLSSPGQTGSGVPVSAGGGSSSGGWSCSANIMNIGNATRLWFLSEAPQHPNQLPWVVNCTNGYINIVWLPNTASSSNVSVVVDTSGSVDPVALTAELLDHVPVPAIKIGVNPAPGLVALPSWFWIEGYDGAPITASQSLASVTVEVQLTPTSYRWSFGDGAKLETATLGRVYPATSDIRHTYEESSLAVGGKFTVTVEFTFSARYRVNGGAWQSLDPINRSFTSPYPVQQLQSILTAQ